jgi:hypothetical protein
MTMTRTRVYIVNTIYFASFEYMRDSESFFVLRAFTPKPLY